VLSNLVYADLPKAEQRNLTPKEYEALTRRGDPEGEALRQEILRSEGIPLSFPKSAHDEAEVALTRPQELNVKRLSSDNKRLNPTILEEQPTKGTGKLPLAERVAEGQRLVNRLFSQAEKLSKVIPGKYDSDAAFTQDYYSTLRNMFKDAQSLAKYTEQYGARGTYDSFLETVAQNSSFKESLNKAAERLPEGERKRNIQVLHDVLETMAFASQDATKRARRATKGMSDRELNKILFDRPMVEGEYAVELSDSLQGLGYNDYKRMAFMLTQKLNRGGLMSKK